MQQEKDKNKQQTKYSESLRYQPISYNKNYDNIRGFTNNYEKPQVLKVDGKPLEDFEKIYQDSQFQHINKDMFVGDRYDANAAIEQRKKEPELNVSRLFNEHFDTNMANHRKAKLDNFSIQLRPPQPDSKYDAPDPEQYSRIADIENQFLSMSQMDQNQYQKDNSTQNQQGYLKMNDAPDKKRAERQVSMYQDARMIMQKDQHEEKQDRIQGDIGALIKDNQNQQSTPVNDHFNKETNVRNSQIDERLQLLGVKPEDDIARDQRYTQKDEDLDAKLGEDWKGIEWKPHNDSVNILNSYSKDMTLKKQDTDIDANGKDASLKKREMRKRSKSQGGLNPEFNASLVHANQLLHMNEVEMGYRSNANILNQSNLLDTNRLESRQNTASKNNTNASKNYNYDTMDGNDINNRDNNFKYDSKIGNKTDGQENRTNQHLDQLEEMEKSFNRKFDQFNQADNNRSISRPNVGKNDVAMAGQSKFKAIDELDKFVGYSRANLLNNQGEMLNNHLNNSMKQVDQNKSTQSVNQKYQKYNDGNMRYLSNNQHNNQKQDLNNSKQNNQQQNENNLDQNRQQNMNQIQNPTMISSTPMYTRKKETLIDPPYNKTENQGDFKYKLDYSTVQDPNSKYHQTKRNQNSEKFVNSKTAKLEKQVNILDRTAKTNTQNQRQDTQKSFMQSDPMGVKFNQNESKMMNQTDFMPNKVNFSKANSFSKNRSKSVAEVTKDKLESNAQTQKRIMKNDLNDLDKQVDKTNQSVKSIKLQPQNQPEPVGARLTNKKMPSQSNYNLSIHNKNPNRSQSKIYSTSHHHENQNDQTTLSLNPLALERSVDHITSEFVPKHDMSINPGQSGFIPQDDQSKAELRDMLKIENNISRTQDKKSLNDMNTVNHLYLDGHMQHYNHIQPPHSKNKLETLYDDTPIYDQIKLDDRTLNQGGSDELLAGLGKKFQVPFDYDGYKKNERKYDRQVDSAMMGDHLDQNEYFYQKQGYDKLNPLHMRLGKDEDYYN